MGEVVDLVKEQTMNSHRVEDGDVVRLVTTLITQLGVAGLLVVMAEISEQQSDRLLLSGERQKAWQCMRDFRVLERAAQTLGNEPATGVRRTLWES